jgi:hypothetical protein
MQILLRLTFYVSNLLIIKVIYQVYYLTFIYFLIF